MGQQALIRRRLGSVGILAIALVTAGFVWPASAPAQSAAQRAVDAAKKICAGKTITIVWEAGLQSLDPLNFSGPKWEQATGCKVKVVEVPTAEMFTKIMQEYRANTGAYDALNVIPAWMRELARVGGAIPIRRFCPRSGTELAVQPITQSVA